MRALAALRMVWASAVWMAVEMLATWCVRKLWGDARPSPTALLLPAQNTHTLCAAATPGVFEPVTGGSRGSSVR